MKETLERHTIEDLNIILRFLAHRNIPSLSKTSFHSFFGHDQVDVLIILGNSIPAISKIGYDVYKGQLVKKIMLVGGIGHSTNYLVKAVKRDPSFKDIELVETSEAHIIKQLFDHWGGVKESDLLIENTSSNCGSNARDALKVLKEAKCSPRSIVLIQDPTMQLRSYASFLKEWRNEKVKIASYAPFIPLFDEMSLSLNIPPYIHSPWDIKRLIDLVMGEIPRLKDDASGYGPKGKNFIAHIDIPKEVLDAYKKLLKTYNEYQVIKKRKRFDQV